MKRRNDDPDEAWFAKLDAIVTGRETPAQENDDLLYMAAKLTDVLSPLSNLDTPGERDRQHPTHMNRQWQQQTMVPVSRRKRPALRAALTVATLLLVLFGVVGACPSSTQASAATRSTGRQIWQAATSFEQVDASSIALLAVKKAGVRPLLPAVVPADTQAVEFGIVTDETSAQTFAAFVADYRITGQDVSVYEQAANLVVASSAAQNVTIGIFEGHLFQDDAGNSILQWYQDGMTCQIASTLPAHELLALARQFHPITRWALIT
jgi:uncharacterized membrane protein YgdD (TMEM256/DUF423 family)